LTISSDEADGGRWRSGTAPVRDGFRSRAGATDFEWPAPLAELAAEARRVGEEAATGRDIREDSWVVAFDREFSIELGGAGGSA
jgi:hypothetical protein